MKTRKLHLDRVRIDPMIDHTLASVGFYAPAVQKVNARWQVEFPRHPDLVREAFMAAVRAVRHHESHISVPTHVLWPAVMEFGAALLAIKQSKTEHGKRPSPDGWLLDAHLFTATNGAFLGWKDLAGQIREQGGPDFTPDALEKAAIRLGLVYQLSPQNRMKRPRKRRV